MCLLCGRRLSVEGQVIATVALLALWAITFVLFYDLIMNTLVLAAGLYMVWNPGRAITSNEARLWGVLFLVGLYSWLSWYVNPYVLLAVLAPLVVLLARGLRRGAGGGHGMRATRVMLVLLVSAMMLVAGAPTAAAAPSSDAVCLAIGVCPDASTGGGICALGIDSVCKGPAFGGVAGDRIKVIFDRLKGRPSPGGGIIQTIPDWCLVPTADGVGRGGDWEAYCGDRSRGMPISPPPHHPMPRCRHSSLDNPFSYLALPLMVPTRGDPVPPEKRKAGACHPFMTLIVEERAGKIQVWGVTHHKMGEHVPRALSVEVHKGVYPPPAGAFTPAVMPGAVVDLRPVAGDARVLIGTAESSKLGLERGQTYSFIVKSRHSYFTDAVAEYRHEPGIVECLVLSCDGRFAPQTDAVLVPKEACLLGFEKGCESKRKAWGPWKPLRDLFGFGVPNAKDAA